MSWNCWQIWQKGQTKSKLFFRDDVSSTKWRNKFDFTTMIPQAHLLSFVFWIKLKAPEVHFENNWPLGTTQITIFIESIMKGEIKLCAWSYFEVFVNLFFVVKQIQVSNCKLVLNNINRLFFSKLLQFSSNK